ncbi:hypothetical protein N7526_008652 [Penicillium atrosanguineum]|nr:hypothetical protein N7526_008652 [Penicillium atrosanguineum]
MEAWRTWFARVKLYAKQKRVWDLCDLDIEKEDRPRGLREPYEPEYPKDRDTEERKEWRDRMDVYKVAYTKWEKQIKGLDDVNEYIISFLDPIHYLILIDYKTPYDRLVYLKSRFARSSAYKEEIQVIRRAEAERQYRLVVIDIGHPKRVLPIWWQARYQEIIIDRKPYDTRDLIKSFRDYKEEIEETLKPTPLPFNKRLYLYGRTNYRHRVVTCYALNEAARPSWFKPNDKTLQKIKKNFVADPA